MAGENARVLAAGSCGYGSTKVQGREWQQARRRTPERATFV